MFLRSIFAVAASVALSAPALAQDPLPPETFGVMSAIAPGPNVIVYQESLSGPGSLVVLGADDLAMKGTMPSGSFGTMLVDPAGKVAYSLSTFLKRYAYGPMETVLQIYDVDTLTVKSEVILPPKGVMALSYAALLQQSADGKFIFAQNATPASSVTVVDLAAGAVAQEIPTPGCWGIYPATTGSSFSTICGDGSLMTYALSADGKTATETTGLDIFDPDADPVFATTARSEAGIVMVTFLGNVIIASDADGTPKKVDSFSLTEGVEGGWVPGGYNLVTYSSGLKLLFVLMHSGGYDGSHKNPSEEVWAVDLAKKAVVGRMPLAGALSITAAPGDKPVLYTLMADIKLVRHELDLAAYATKVAGELPLVDLPFLATATP